MYRCFPKALSVVVFVARLFFRTCWCVCCASTLSTILWSVFASAFSGEIFHLEQHNFLSLCLPLMWWCVYWLPVVQKKKWSSSVFLNTCNISHMDCYIQNTAAVLYMHSQNHQFSCSSQEQFIMLLIRILLGLCRFLRVRHFFSMNVRATILA